jgi:DNA-binding transcriptional LysR family regulator
VRAFAREVRTLESVTIEQLRTLRAVVEAGSFSAAARKLGRVQAAVSQSIDRLEAQLGLRLFDRSGRVPRLTQHGEAVLVAATRVAADVEALDELVASLKRGAETTLRIAFDTMFPIESLVAFAREFQTEHAGVELSLLSEVLSAVTAQVRDKQASLGVAIEDADMTGLEQRALAELRLVSVAAPQHALARREGSIDAAGLTDSVQIVLGERSDEPDQASARHGVFSPRTWRVVDLATKHALIASGLGFGHLPEHLVREDLRAGRLVELRLAVWGGAAVRRSLVLVRRPETVLGPVARWAQERLGELCRLDVERDPPGNHAT